MIKIENDKIEEMISLYKTGLSFAEIGKLVNRNRTSVRGILKRRGFEFTRKGPKRKYTLNEKFFDHIDTPEKAYFLGWFVSDGHNNIKNGSIRINLQEGDKEVLIILNSLIESNRPLLYIEYSKYGYYGKTPKEPWQNQYALDVGSRYISNKLLEIGYDNNKSISACYPLINYEIEKYFIRGLFEGDGTIRIFKDMTNAAVRFAGTQKVCDGIKIFLEKNGIPCKVFDVKTCWAAGIYGTNNALKFFNLIYGDKLELILKRKYESFVKLVNIKLRRNSGKRQNNDALQESISIINNNEINNNNYKKLITNNRNIKFRIFDKETNEVKILSNLSLTENSISFIENSDKEGGVKNIGDIIIDQFTGFIDQDDKEIFENDIMEIKTNKNKFLGKIAWSYFYGGFVIEMIGKLRYPANYFKTSKIIGNIHINSELLLKNAPIK